MKKIIGAVFAALFLVLALEKPAPAMDRVQWLFGQNPPSSWQNFEQRYTRIGFGQFIYDALGTSSFYHNCTVQVSSGLNVVVGPAGANTNCAVYQYLAEELTSFGGPGGTALAADPNQVQLQGLIYGGATTSAIGPLSPGTSGGQSINNLLECKVLIQDTTSQTGTFISALGVVTTSAVNRDRQDSITCQNKAGTSATTGTQVTPTVDAGWVAIGFVAIPNGTATITGGMINVLTTSQFNGFGQINSNNTWTAANTFSSNVAFTKTPNAVQIGVAGTQSYFTVSNAGTGQTTGFGTGTTNCGATIVGVSTTAICIGSIGQTQNIAGDESGDVGIGGYLRVTSLSDNGTVAQNFGTSIYDASGTKGSSVSNGVFAFGNAAVGSTSYTVIGAMNAACGTSGISGIIFQVNATATPVLCVNNSGNVGISGTAYTNSSSRTLKMDIGASPYDALELFRHFEMHRYHMKADPHGPWLYGPIAEELPSPFGTANHMGYNNTQTLSFAAAAIRELDATVTAKEKEDHGALAALWLQVHILYGLIGLLVLERLIRMGMNRFR